MTVPIQPKIYHIVHVDRLTSIVTNRCLWCDAEVIRQQPQGTTIGMGKIKQRRLTELTLTSHPGLYVGQCVPFYFCPRSVMLYLICKRNHEELSYRGGQDHIVHLEADLFNVVRWADQNQSRWAFTLSNAGSYHFEDRSDIGQLEGIDWAAVRATNWQACRESKQAEFLIGALFPGH